MGEVDVGLDISETARGLDKQAFVVNVIPLS